MNTIDAIQQRRAVKHYDPDHEMTEEEIQTLMSSTILSPTSFNIQNWRFVLVKDKDLRAQVRTAAWDQAQITDASLVIVLCANKTSFRNSEDYWVTAPAEVKDFLVTATKSYYEGKDKLQIDEAHRSCGIAAQTLMLAAKSMGYDSCPMVGFDFEKVGELIKLPQEHLISMIIVVGKATKPAYERGGQLPLDQVVLENTF